MWQAAARIVLQDWNDGRIPYYTLPPSRNSDVAGSAAVVSEFASEFTVDDINEKSILSALLGHSTKGFAVESLGEADIDLDGAREEESEEEELMEGEMGTIGVCPCKEGWLAPFGKTAACCTVGMEEEEEGEFSAAEEDDFMDDDVMGVAQRSSNKWVCCCWADGDCLSVFMP